MAASGVRPRDLILGALLVAGLGFRLAGLGDVPLNDSEAMEALGAAQATDDAASRWPSAASPAAASAGYRTGTWLLFQAFNAGDAAARLLPAAAGALVILTPWFLRKRIGTAGALTAAFLLTLSPTLTAVARTAGGASLAVASLAFGAVILARAADGSTPSSRATWALAACLAVGLGSGPAFFHGLVVLATIAAAAMRAGRLGASGFDEARVVAARALIPGLLGAVAISIGLGVVPGGATSLAEGLRQWLAGWLPPGEMHSLTPAAALIVYEPAVLVFGLVGFFSAGRRGERWSSALGWGAVVALLLTIVYPARSGEMTVWITLPLAILAGPEIAGALARWTGGQEKWVGLAYASLLAVLWAYAGLQLSAYVGGIGPAVNPLIPEARLAVAVGAVAVGALATVLIGVGWNWQAVRLGGGLAGALLLVMMTVSSSWTLNHSESRVGARELWRVSGPTSGLQRLSATIDSLSRTTRTGPNRLPIRIDTPDLPPSVAWALRAVPRFSTNDTSLPEAPPLVLRRQAPEAALPGTYLGQSITLSERWDFGGPIPPDLGGWLWRRRIPVAPSVWVLYVRDDIATLGESTGDGE